MLLCGLSLDEPVLFDPTSISSGQMGVVYPADKSRLLRISRLSSQLRHFDEKEVNMLRTLQHPNVLTLLHQEYICIGPSAWIDVRLLVREDISLYDWILESKVPKPVDDIFRAITGLYAALDYIHSRGIVHRDVTVKNVVWKSFGGPRATTVLIDFGVAALYPAPALINRFTATAYRPPEAFLGGVATAGYDVWSAGCIFAELLLGRPLFVCPSSLSRFSPEYDTMACILLLLGPPCRTDNCIEWQTDKPYCSMMRNVETLDEKQMRTANFILYSQLIYLARPDLCASIRDRLAMILSISVTYGQRYSSSKLFKIVQTTNQLYRGLTGDGTCINT